MKIEVNTIFGNVSIDSEEAFKILCKSLDMECVLINEGEFFIKKDLDGEIRVYRSVDSKEEVYDDRGYLFIALSNVAVNMFPNVAYRSADYIYE